MATIPKNRKTHAERRCTERMPCSEAVSIQVMHTGQDNSCVYKVIPTRTLDVSAFGMRLIVKEGLEPGRLYDVCVQLRNHPRRFLLTGETRWCRRQSSGEGYEVGIKVLEGVGTDYLAWAETFAAVQNGG